MSRTTDRIVAASKLPLSIVIVGVGGADFTKMVCVCVCVQYVCIVVCVCVCIAYGFTVHPLTQEVLDADDNPLANKYGEKMTRDIVQFVPL